MASKQYLVGKTLKEGVMAENERTNDDVKLITKLDTSYDIWIVEGTGGILYLEWEFNLCNPFYYD